MATTITANGINFPDGSASAPSIGGTDTNTGLFTGSDIVGFATGGNERLRIDAGGRLVVGTNSTRNTRLGTNSFSGLLQIESDSEAAATIARFNNGAGSSRLVLQKARGTKASPSVVQSGDDCGQILFSGWDGDTFTNAAYIKVEVDGTPGDDDMPGRLIFATTPDGTTTSQERLRITSDGNIGIGITSPDSLLHLKKSSGAKVTIESDDNNDAWINFSGASNEMSVGFDKTINSLIVSNSDSIQANQRGAITSAGKVGIGTISPVGNLEVRGTKANFIVAKTGLTVKSTDDLHSTYDFLQIGAGGAIASYSTETATASTWLIHNAYRATDTNWKRRYADTACKIEMNSPGGEIEFFTAGTANANTTITWTPTVQVKPNGNLNISDGDLVIGTAGHGIDFSATSGTGTSELLEDYEEGTWTVTDLTSDGVTFTNQSNRYTKIGRQVFVQANIQFPNSGLSGAAMKMGGLPFAPGTGTTSSGIVSVAVNVSNGNGYANGVQLHIDTDGIHATYDGALRKGGFGNSQFQNRQVIFAFSYST